ncbi:MAG: tetratricopeptide repeat protein [Hyphomicrobium sp.]|jgi:Flp pilus assembly protein TadD|uniref:tetratricopeptide repeat protein n=1 Tax=Hyphomicrobium sp. TaxID=82 RepID=UPI0025BF72EF|nr:tetratricopeptide repeat protein [Hyphomicrobium sp.]MBX9864451.1 tetratricopeptide repeat protein [Hyphomicrobium sp.]
MAVLDARNAVPKPVRSIGVIAALSACLMLGACAQVGGGDESGGLFSALTPGAAEPAAAQAPSDPRLATEYWGKEYGKNPRDLDAALAYAQNLRVTGQKREAMAVLQQASIVHGSDKKLAADYGRLALELDQIGVAKKVLAVADDPTNPDWRIVLARGTALAKEGSYREAITFYERAQALNPGHPSVLNNLALAYTMSGEPERGEQLLRQASASGTENAKVRQNLALVLGLQGKYDEATKVASVDLDAAQAKANTALLKKMVKLDGKPMTPSAPDADTWAPAVVATKAPVPVAVTKAAPVAVAKAAAPSAAPMLRASKVETGFGDATGSGKAASLFEAD